MSDKGAQHIEGHVIAKSDGWATSVSFGNLTAGAIEINVWFGSDEGGWFRDVEQGVTLTNEAFDRLVEHVKAHRP